MFRAQICPNYPEILRLFCTAYHESRLAHLKIGIPNYLIVHIVYTHSNIFIRNTHKILYISKQFWIIFLQQKLLINKQNIFFLSKMVGNIPGNIGYSCTYREKKDKIISRGNIRFGTGWFLFTQLIFHSYMIM